MVPVYGNWGYVQALLSDLAGLGLSEIVLIDDAHPDPPPPSFSAGETPIRYYRRDRNGGFAAAVNTGVRLAAGDFVLLLNADLRITHDVARQLVHRLAKRPDAIHGTKVVSSDGPAVNQCRPFPTRRGMLIEFCTVLRLVPKLDRRLRGVAGPEPTTTTKVAWLSGACLAFARSTFDRIGPLEERFVMYVEDAEWQMRANGLGIDSLYHADLAVQHDTGHGAFDSQAGVDRWFLAGWQANLTLLEMQDKAGLTTRALLLAIAVVNIPFAIARRMAATTGRVPLGPTPQTYLRIPFQPPHPALPAPSRR